MLDFHDFEELKYLEGASYLVLALEARKQLIDLLLKQERSIRDIFAESVDDIANELIKGNRDGNVYQIIENLDIDLRNRADEINRNLVKIFGDDLKISVEAGLYQSEQATLSFLKNAKIDWEPIKRVYFRTGEKAVEEMHQRIIDGLNLSDRIWDKSNKSMNIIGSIVKEGIRDGKHPVEVAEILQQYVKEGGKTLAINYPNMIERLDFSLPNDLSYEALRLARTEMAAAFGHATIESAKLNPGLKGIRWLISNAGVACDVCKDNASRDSGLGKGVYLVDELPEYPAHPNCMCTLVEINENTRDFVDRLIDWNKNPLSQPDIEEWYQTVYKQGMVA